MVRISLLWGAGGRRATLTWPFDGAPATLTEPRFARWGTSIGGCCGTGCGVFPKGFGSSGRPWRLRRCHSRVSMTRKSPGWTIVWRKRRAWFLLALDGVLFNGNAKRKTISCRGVWLVPVSSRSTEIQSSVAKSTLSGTATGANPTF